MNILSKVSQVLCAVMLGLLASAVHATSPGEDALQSVFSTFTTLQAHFKQTIKDADGAVLQTSKGEMMINRPGKFRWETTAPTHQLIIADGKQLWIYDPELAQVMVQDQTAGMGNTPASLLSGAVQDLTKTFSVQQQPSAANLQRFVLTPKDANDLFESLTISFKQGQLATMQLHDNSGQTTAVEFSDVKMNHPLAEKMFIFTPPAGVDVVNNSKQSTHSSVVKGE